MSFLLDTTVVSEWIKPRLDPGVVDWLSKIDEDSVFFSAMTFAELRHGIERLPTGERRKHLDEWLRGDLPLRFEQRILPVDGAVADEWGRLLARHESLGRPIHAMDAIIGATAQAHALKLVTRNAPNCDASVKSIVNPWR